MLYRWKKEYQEGGIMDKPKRVRWIQQQPKN